MIAVFDPAKVTHEVERDTDFDGKMDVKELYTDGQLTGMRRDCNGDNKPDQWDTYADGELTATTYDDNFDGKVDRKSDNARRRAATACVLAGSDADDHDVATDPRARNARADTDEVRARESSSGARPPRSTAGNCARLLDREIHLVVAEAERLPHRGEELDRASRSRRRQSATIITYTVTPVAIRRLLDVLRISASSAVVLALDASSAMSIALSISDPVSTLMSGMLPQDGTHAEALLVMDFAVGGAISAMHFTKLGISEPNLRRLLLEREQPRVLARGLEHFLGLDLVERERVLHAVEELDLRLGELAVGDAASARHAYAARRWLPRRQARGNRWRAGPGHHQPRGSHRPPLGHRDQLVAREPFEER